MTAATLSKQQLAQILLVKLKLRHPDYTFTLITNQFQDDTPMQIHVLRNEQKIFNFSIDKLYQSYQDTPQDPDILCAPLLDMVKDFLTSIQEEEIFLPMVVTEERLKEIETSLDAHIPYIPLVANLLVTFVLDKESRILYLTEEQLKKNFPNQDIKAIYQQTKRNLSLLLPQLKIEKSPLFEATLRVDYNYELSMLLIFEQWKHFLPFNTPPAIAIAARDAVIFADSTNSKQVDALNKVISNMHDYDTPPLVKQLLTIKNNSLQILEHTL